MRSNGGDTNEERPSPANHRCESQPLVYCFECDVQECDSCSKLFHELPGNIAHKVTPTSPCSFNFCTKDASCYCRTCQHFFCKHCSDKIHSLGNRRKHERRDLLIGTFILVHIIRSN
eukprot:TRINITY_DN16491_c0_g1::TRINITY_DN16491_c0_g1_i1::g.1809::m.1809 TRINITY_DN16491_c0_g1::TRINITY_DN16491_c0_g1_i1::g.1809  ORF type:complete len:117 (-),score=-16.91,zf-B_box/PF00643.19/0.021,zf-B_box/PF00643.19/0.0081,C1_4/PF07975.7/0.78,C1_4/PF07975.7/2.2e+03 TRINITY_DN16491_c0_g1_i1:404-754(-)